MKYLIFLLSLTFLAHQESYPCSCLGFEPFLQVFPNAELVAMVKVTKHLTFISRIEKKVPLSMEVEIVDVYRGEEKRTLVTVWGDPGNLCRPYLSRFNIDGYYLIGFNKCKANPYNEEKDSDYFISICGAYWLTVDFAKELVIGNISGVNGSQTMALKELRHQITDSTYEQVDYRFKARVPNSWIKYGELNDPSAGVFIITWLLPEVFSDMEKTKIANAISVTSLKNPDIKDISSLVHYEFSRISDVLISKSQLNPQDANSYLVHSKIDGLNYKSKMYFRFKNGIGYIINFTATEGTFDINLEKFERFNMQLYLKE